jgi:hypothetical protein
MELISPNPELNLYDPQMADLDLSGASAAGQICVQ